ncbi:MAG: Na+/H+ antiporter subunit E [Spirochaetales bacterium]
MKSLWSRLVAGAAVMLLWIMLTSPAGVQELGTAVVLGILAAIVPLPGRQVWGQIRFMPKRVGYAFVYFFVFSWALLKSTLDVAYRVVAPSLPINPGFVTVKTRLKSPLGRMFLANSITLTPGTITVDIDGETLVIHWIYRGTDDMEVATAEIVGTFEKYLEVIFD